MYGFSFFLWVPFGSFYYYYYYRDLNKSFSLFCSYLCYIVSSLTISLVLNVIRVCDASLCQTISFSEKTFFHRFDF